MKINFKPEKNQTDPNPSLSQDKNLVLPSRDFSFKRIFGGHEKSLISLIEAITRIPKGAITSLIYLNKEKTKDHKNGKTCILDILAELSTGHVVTIEIQLKDVGCYLKRARYYEAAELRDLLESGEIYDNLPPIIAIHLLDYMIYPDIEDSIHEYELINRNLLLKSLTETNMQRKKLLEQAAVLSGENIYIVVTSM